MGERVLRVLIVAALIATTASIVVGRYIRGRQQRILVTLVPEGKPSAEEIREVVRVLSERAKGYGEDMGVTRMSIRAAEDGTINATLWAQKDPDEFIRRLVRVGEMELRLVAPKGGNPESDVEYEQVPWRQQYYSLKDLGETYETVTQLWVQKEPALRVRSFKSVLYHTEGLGSSPVVTVRFQPDDAKVFNEVRRGNVGRELAVVMDGDALVSAVIADSVETDRIQIRGIRGTAEAKRVAKMLRIGALPVKLRLEGRE